MLTILITGSNRGLGLEFVTKFLSRGEKVIATFRTSNDLTDLNFLKEKYPKNLILIELDVGSEESRTHAITQIKSMIDHIDILINNAGITGKRNLQLGEIKNSDLLEVFNVNAFSVVEITQKLLDLLEKSPNPKVINVSTNRASITNCEHVDDFAYSGSKAALNMFSKLMANALVSNNIIVIPISPGWVKTRMGSEDAPLTKDTSVSKMITLIDSLTLADTGKFFNYQNIELPW